MHEVIWFHQAYVILTQSKWGVTGVAVLLFQGNTCVARLLQTLSVRIWHAHGFFSSGSNLGARMLVVTIIICVLTEG